MLSSAVLNLLKQELRGNESSSSLRHSSIGGGSINHTYLIELDAKDKFFLKINDAGLYPGLFEKEKAGLLFLHGQDCVAIPSVRFCGSIENEQFLLLEWIEPGQPNDRFWKRFGEELARLHQLRGHHFGFKDDNYIGSLVQMNTECTDWVEFFIEKRLRPPIRQAQNKGLLSTQQIDSFERLFPKLNTIFNHEPPSLLHGDLWNGNFLCDRQAQPFLIDPAIYYGHRSMDLAMSTLFGGFDQAFYDSYHYHFPLPANYREQWELANLYPLLIHLNLFGNAYLKDIVVCLKKYAG